MRSHTYIPAESKSNEPKKSANLRTKALICAGFLLGSCGLVETEDVQRPVNAGNFITTTTEAKTTTTALRDIQDWEIEMQTNDIRNMFPALLEEYNQGGFIGIKIEETASGTNWIRNPEHSTNVATITINGVVLDEEGNYQLPADKDYKVKFDYNNQDDSEESANNFSRFHINADGTVDIQAGIIKKGSNKKLVTSKSIDYEQVEIIDGKNEAQYRYGVTVEAFSSINNLSVENVIDRATISPEFYESPYIYDEN